MTHAEADEGRSMLAYAVRGLGQTLLDRGAWAQADELL